MPATEEQSTVKALLSDITDHCENIIANAKTCVQGDVEKFVSKDISKLFQLVGVYKNAFQRLKVNSKRELEEIVSHFFRCDEIREKFDYLLDSEQAWDDFLQEVDSQLVVSDTKPLVEGEPGPNDTSVVDARTGQTTTLEEFLGSGPLVLVLLRHFA
ncbi:selenoprotein l [Plakobranchus ocellatus]|uniref:Selenoprotein l n=1 Tax=Plakobranchus ocellatus TaxID=259542 RepID=A0AAV4C0C2_9GAST|nr:selenoprotein l [Plakobranchus ocellatus]